MARATVEPPVCLPAKFGRVEASLGGNKVTSRVLRLSACLWVGLVAQRNSCGRWCRILVVRSLFHETLVETLPGRIACLGDDGTGTALGPTRGRYERRHAGWRGKHRDAERLTAT